MNKKLRDNCFIRDMERSFDLSVPEMNRIMKDFGREMKKGLAGKNGSLKMLPAYVGRATGNEKGKFIALDLGGTNFRVLELELKGGGNFGAPKVMKFTIDKKHTAGRGEDLFDFIARCIKAFINEEHLNKEAGMKLGFTFSFPMDQKALAKGLLIRWTKGFSASGVKGKDVVGLLRKSLVKEGLGSLLVSALANDTVGTLVACSYREPICDVGIIIGTGTNACYLEKISEIKKLKGFSGLKGNMIINTEWGNFNRLKLTKYDAALDRASRNRGEQILEKMVSGMYLGEIVRLIIEDMAYLRNIDKGIIAPFRERGSFKTEYMSEIEGDTSPGLSIVKRVLKRAGADVSSAEDRNLLKKICAMVSRRGARLSASALAAVICKMDRALSRKHTVAMDGSLYEKHPAFAKNMKRALREIFGSKASRINIKLTKDGSGTGAAIIAAIAGS